MLNKYFLNPHLAQAGVWCFPSAVQEYSPLDNGNFHNMSEETSRGHPLQLFVTGVLLPSCFLVFSLICVV